MSYFENAMLQLDAIGITDVILPFILVFTIVFAILQKTTIFGAADKGKRFNVIIALVLGLAVVFPHVTGRGPDVVPIINSLLPSASIIAIFAIMVLLIIGVWGGNTQFGGTTIGSWMILISLGVLTYIFLRAAGVIAGTMPRWLAFLDDPAIRSAIIVLLVFAILIAFITKEDKPDKDGFMKKMNDLFREVGKGGS